LLDDENYVKLINQKIPGCVEEFKEFTDRRVLWDLIKYRIRQFTMKYSKEKARKRREDLLMIETSLKRCEEACSVDPSELNLENLENMKMKYDSHFECLSKGAIIRSRANWYEKGEKSNKYFLNLESYRGAKSCIARSEVAREIGSS